MVNGVLDMVCVSGGFWQSRSHMMLNEHNNRFAVFLAVK